MRSCMHSVLMTELDHSTLCTAKVSLTVVVRTHGMCMVHNACRGDPDRCPSPNALSLSFRLVLGGLGGRHRVGNSFHLLLDLKDDEAP